ncbi:DUF1330 domain-containing protein [Pseudoalteromonas piscicida]|uniref:DUF1330 domain-containing protein n=1 Tax=Pseudoalteromonas piscicida TaxID=43662 RepID=UPI001EFDA8AC|nr:DUF1330 domain-containing protein [Pseudoalteromonas piscicida]MCG9771463.1 DUF1330 domain-containing protein [Pseudoalteromonas piscicida]
MNVENSIGPSEDQIKAMQAPGPDQPICLVNMLKYKEHAVYPDSRDSHLSGKEAYEIYAKAVEDLLPEYGGKIVFVGDVTYLGMGSVEELWDEVAIVMFPSRSQMLKVSMSDHWKEACLHKVAGLEGQLSIETVQSSAFPNLFG